MSKKIAAEDAISVSEIDLKKLTSEYAIDKLEFVKSIIVKFVFYGPYTYALYRLINEF